MSRFRYLAELLRYTLFRPGMLLRAVKAGWRLRARDWYKRSPFLPLPPREYLEWRLHTAYGAGAVPDPREVDRYLRWMGEMRRSPGRRLR